MKHRIERVRELIKRELGEIIVREVSFGGALVTIQEADITPDLKNAHIYVSAIGKDVDKNAVIGKLLDHRNELQHALSKRVVLKYTPQLHFHFDDAIERGTRVIDLLGKIDIPDED